MERVEREETKRRHDAVLMSEQKANKLREMQSATLRRLKQREREDFKRLEDSEVNMKRRLAEMCKESGRDVPTGNIFSGAQSTYNPNSSMVDAESHADAGKGAQSGPSSSSQYMSSVPRHVGKASKQSKIGKAKERDARSGRYEDVDDGDDGGDGGDGVDPPIYLMQRHFPAEHRLKGDSRESKGRQPTQQGAVDAHGYACIS
jgi:hypothetical protein